MTRSFKLGVYFLIFILLFQIVPSHTLAFDGINEESETENETIYLFSSNEEESIELYEDKVDKEIITSIPDGTLVDLIEMDEEYSKIKYIPELVENTQMEEVAKTDENIYVGFVHTIHIVHIQDKDDFLKNREGSDSELDEEFIEQEQNSEQNEEFIEPEKSFEQDDLPEEVAENLANPDNGQSLEIGKEEPVDEGMAMEDSSEEMNQEEIAVSTMSTLSTLVLQGIALGEPTHVYSGTSKNSTVLKSYKQGHLLKFRSYDANWYVTSVYINGAPQTGYIHINDIDILLEQQRIQGYSQAQPVHVYSTPSRNAGVLKSYQYGHALIYRSYSSQWHQATVYLNGKAHTGYIATSDVSSEIQIRGIAAAPTVSVYSNTSRNSTKLKTYKQGHKLIYRTYNNSWYKATVYLNGKAHTGFIHVNDVENNAQNQATLTGIGLESSTAVYSSASKTSSVLKSYSQGHVLKYRTFTNSWYEATVIINGKARIGYIHKNDVENVTTKQSSLTGVATKSPTKVYSRASTGASVLKSYNYASNLKYKTFSADWYQATVYVNGKAKTGYIHKNDVLNTNGKTIVLDAGHGGSDSGAIGIGIVEKTLNLDIAHRAQTLLERAGFTVIMTRTTDVFIPLADRAAIANNSNADIFISIHGNSFNQTTSGIESFWYGKYERENSIRLANALQSNLLDFMNMRHRRVAEGNFHVIRETKIPSSLIEVGFIDNANDAAKLRQSQYRQFAAQGILHGVISYFD